MRDYATDAAGKLKTVRATGATSLSTSSDDFTCDGASCTFKAEVRTDAPEAMWAADKAKIGFTGVADTGLAGKKDCVGSVKMKFNQEKKASCKVTFSLAQGSSADVTGEWRSRDLLTCKPDTGDIKDAVKADMNDLVD